MLFLISGIIYQNSLAQIGIGTTTPHESAILDVTSNNKGFLPPRMSVLERNYIINPAEGLVVFCTNCCPKGALSFFDSKIWKTIIDCSDEVIIEDDFDGDGILNVVDIDDDNDGILDNLECPIEYADFTGLNLNTDASGPTQFTSSQTINGNALPSDIIVHKPNSITPNTFGEIFVGVGIGSIPNEAVILMLNTGADTGEEFYTEFEFSRPNQINIFANSSFARSNINSLDEFTFEPLNPTTNFEWEYYNIADSDTITDGYKITISHASGSNHQDFAQFILNPNMKIDGFKVTYKSNGLSATNSAQFLFNLGCSDNDDDGYPNNFDLDSDSDGCSDAYESGMTTSTQTLYHFPPPYGVNGLSNGLETAIDNGITAISPNISNVLNGTCP